MSFFKSFEANAGELDFRCIRTLYLRYLFLFHKYYLNNSKVAVSDFGDLANIGLFEYCDAVVLEKNAFEYLNQIKTRFPILKNTTLYNMDFMRENNFL